MNPDYNYPSGTYSVGGIITTNTLTPTGVTSETTVQLQALRGKVDNLIAEVRTNKVSVDILQNQVNFLTAENIRKEGRIAELEAAVKMLLEDRLDIHDEV